MYSFRESLHASEASLVADSPSSPSTGDENVFASERPLQALDVLRTSAYASSQPEPNSRAGGGTGSGLAAVSSPDISSFGQQM